MAQVAAHQEQFQDRGTKVVLISFEGRQFAGPWLREIDVPFPMLIDRRREGYNAFGLERSFWHSWGLKNLWYYFKALMQGREIASASDDTTQLGGDFIVDGNGILQHVYYSENPTDRPGVEQLLTVLRKNSDLEMKERE